jgi:triacylglycerol esterase/lipase EstA (alpha/beta hydrolase family)
MWPNTQHPLFLFGVDTTSPESFTEEVTIPQSRRSLSWTSPEVSKGVHLFVFVHGFLGNAYDLRRYRNQLLHYLNELGLHDVQHSYLISTFNERDTMSHMSTLGNNLANEIWQHIFEYNLEGTVEKISFICHSMGGLIARMAMRNEILNPYKILFHSYTSFASPHCSLLLHSHSVLDPCNYELTSDWDHAEYLQI